MVMVFACISFHDRVVANVIGVAFRLDADLSPIGRQEQVYSLVA